MLTVEEARIGVIGMGYVGLPLAVEFGKKMPTLGFDINAGRISELKSGRDSTLEVDAAELAEADQLGYTDRLETLGTCNVFIVTVPTPVDRYKRP
ncbi:MAG: Vi polysaccharide biosynthesis UDP-N-acetylglucosamine C-6 dehydrogenase TviB, partial [Thiogranum sp.]